MNVTLLDDVSEDRETTSWKDTIVSIVANVLALSSLKELFPG